MAMGVLILLGLSFAGHLQSSKVSILAAVVRWRGETRWAQWAHLCPSTRGTCAALSREPWHAVGTIYSNRSYIGSLCKAGWHYFQDAFAALFLRPVKYSGALYSASSDQLCRVWGCPMHVNWFWKPSKLYLSLLWPLLSFKDKLQPGTDKIPPPPLAFIPHKGWCTSDATSD